jgi:CyaY protein
MRRPLALTRIICSIPMAQIVMTDLEFLDRAELLLKAVELACDRINDDGEADIDNQRVGGMITLTFENRSQIIINLQKPLHEVWLAARSGGYHFKFDGQHWADTKGQGEFFERLGKDASIQTGLALTFTA